MSLKGNLRIVERTDVGQVRDHNEDFIFADAARGIALLADGMGGMNAGEVASSMSVHVVVDELVGFVDGASTLQSADIEEDEQPSSEIGFMQATVEKANSAVFHVSQTQPQCRGMGTTIVATLFQDDKVVVGHIGDSRLYRFCNGELDQITKDHSFVQELIDKGLYTKEEARSSSQKNVVTRAVGIAPTVEVEVNVHDVLPDDLYLLCSDGLTDLVPDKDIRRSIDLFGNDLAGMADHLVEIANASGGKDNISIILIRVLKPYPAAGNLLDRIVGWFE
jgi:serine/threonine protein phosphatase PrpC